MELLALFIVKKRRTVAKKIPVVNSLLNEDEGSSEKKIGRFQPIKVEYELVEYETARVRNDRNLAKVRHSQRINDSLISCWVITEREGTIVSAHCLGCKAGLAESCSHVASVLRPRFVQIPTDQMVSCQC